MGEVRHVFTHFALKLEVYAAEAARPAPNGFTWMALDRAAASLPTVFAKALRKGLGRPEGGRGARRSV